MRGFLIISVDGPDQAVFSKSHELGEPSFEDVAKLAAKHGYEPKPDGHRRSFEERKLWPLTIRAYTSFNREGLGRSGSSLWSFPAKIIPCHFCGGRGLRGGRGADPIPRTCGRCRGTGRGRSKKVAKQDKAKKRYFCVWLDKNVTGCEASYEVVELPGDATQAQIDEECGDALDVMISNDLDTGWNEVTEAEAKKIKRKFG